MQQNLCTVSSGMCLKDWLSLVRQLKCVILWYCSVPNQHVCHPRCLCLKEMSLFKQCLGHHSNKSPSVDQASALFCLLISWSHLVSQQYFTSVWPCAHSQSKPDPASAKLCGIIRTPTTITCENTAHFSWWKWSHVDSSSICSKLFFSRLRTLISERPV